MEKRLVRGFICVQWIAMIENKNEPYHTEICVLAQNEYGNYCWKEGNMWEAHIFPTVEDALDKLEARGAEATVLPYIGWRRFRWPWDGQDD